MPTGRLITLEGIDGSGKSTASRALADALTARGVDAEWTAEPTATPLGRAVRASLADAESAPAAEAFLFMADHLNHVQWIRSRLADAPGRVVVSDRYADSCYAYQGALLADELQAAGVEDPVMWLRGVQAPFHRDPDLTLLLDLPVATALERVAARGAAAKFERAKLLERVRQNYLRLARELPYYRVLDAAQPPDAIAADALRAATELLEKA